MRRTSGTSPSACTRGTTVASCRCRGGCSTPYSWGLTDAHPETGQSRHGGVPGHPGQPPGGAGAAGGHTTRTGQAQQAPQHCTVYLTPLPLHLRASSRAPAPPSSGWPATWPTLTTSSMWRCSSRDSRREPGRKETFDPFPIQSLVPLTNIPNFCVPPL